jgi:hypothetical protein
MENKLSLFRKIFSKTEHNKTRLERAYLAMQLTNVQWRSFQFVIISAYL